MEHPGWIEQPEGHYHFVDSGEALPEPACEGRAGPLWKKGSGRRNWRRRFVVARGWFLFYFNKETDSTPLGVVPLEGADVSAVTAVEHKHRAAQKGFEFHVSHPERRTFRFVADTERERAQWVDCVAARIHAVGALVRERTLAGVDLRASAQRIEAFGDGLSRSVVGQPAAVVIRVPADDVAGGLHQASDFRVCAECCGDRALLDVTALEGGRDYSVTYTPQASGLFVLSILFRRHPIRGSPFHHLVLPQQVAAHDCIADVGALRERGAPLNEELSFVVAAMDARGRPVQTGGTRFDFFVDGFPGATQAVADNWDGSYSFTFSLPCRDDAQLEALRQRATLLVDGATGARRYRLTDVRLVVTVDGVHIPDSPINVDVVLPGSPDGEGRPRRRPSAARVEADPTARRGRRPGAEYARRLSEAPNPYADPERILARRAPGSGELLPVTLGTVLHAELTCVGNLVHAARERGALPALGGPWLEDKVQRVFQTYALGRSAVGFEQVTSLVMDAGLLDGQLTHRVVEQLFFAAAEPPHFSLDYGGFFRLLVRMSQFKFPHVFAAAPHNALAFLLLRHYATLGAWDAGGLRPEAETALLADGGVLAAVGARCRSLWGVFLHFAHGPAGESVAGAPFPADAPADAEPLLAGGGALINERGLLRLCERFEVTPRVVSAKRARELYALKHPLTDHAALPVPARRRRQEVAHHRETASQQERYDRMVAARVDGVPFCDFVDIVALIAIIGFSQSSYHRLYPTPGAKVEALLGVWGLGDEESVGRLSVLSG